MALENKLEFTTSASLIRKEDHISEDEIYNHAGKTRPANVSKHLLKNALTDDMDGREVYVKGIDHSYYYKGYTIFKMEELS